MTILGAFIGGILLSRAEKGKARLGPSRENGPKSRALRDLF
jgi:hypothetical protein